MPGWPFVGRVAERERIGRLLRSRPPTGVLIAGGQGVGKTRLGALAREQATAAGFAVHHDGDFYADDAPPMDPAEMQAMYEGVAAFNDEAIAADAMVFGAGLMPPDTATVVRTEGGEMLLTDGPYAETKEFLGGFWIIKATDLDAALEWARKAADALQGGPVEVRPLQEETED